MFPGGFKFIAVHFQPQEPAPEGVGGVVGFCAARARCAYREGLVGNRHAQLDVGLDFARVKCAVEGPELNGALLEHTVQVQQVVAALVVMLVGAVFPILVGVPKPGEFLGAGRAAAVQGLKEVLVDRKAPSRPAFRANPEGLGQKVLLGVDQVDQVPQGFGRVCTQTNVHVDAAGRVSVCPGGPQCPHAGLHSFDVFPPANGADEFCALVARPGDACVADQLPPPPVRRGDLPSVVRAPDVSEGRAFTEGFRDHLRGPLSRDAVHFYLDTERLVFHEKAPFRRRLFPPARCGFFARNTSITQTARHSNNVSDIFSGRKAYLFVALSSQSGGFLIHARGGFFSRQPPPFFVQKNQPQKPAATGSPARPAAQKNARRNRD